MEPVRICSSLFREVTCGPRSGLPAVARQLFLPVQSDGQEIDMRGVITGKDVLWHSVTIVRLFGPRCFLRCLRAALSTNPSTFLEVVYGA